MSKPDWLEITEYISVFSSVCGTVAAAVTQQAVYAAAPIALTLGLNLLNRERANKLTRNFSETATMEVREAVREEIAPLGDRLEQLESKSQQFRNQAKQRIAQIKELSRESGEAAIALVHQILDPIGDKLDALESEVQASHDERNKLRQELDSFPESLAKLESVLQQVRKETAKASQIEPAISEQLERSLNPVSDRLSELERSLTELTGLEQQVNQLKEAAMETVRETIETYSSRLEKIETQSGRYGTRIEEIRALVRAGETGSDRAEGQETGSEEEDAIAPVSLDIYYRRLDELESEIERYSSANEEQLSQLKAKLKESLERAEEVAIAKIDAALLPFIERLEKLEQSQTNPIPTTPSVSPDSIEETPVTETEDTAAKPEQSPKQLSKEESEPESSVASSLPPQVPSQYRKEKITTRETAATPPPPSEPSEPLEEEFPDFDLEEQSENPAGNRIIGDLESSIGEAVNEIQGFVGNLFKGKTRPDGVALGNVRGWRGYGAIAGHADGVTSVCISPDGQKIASGDRDNTIKIWQLETGAELFNLSGPEWFAAANSIVWSPDSRIIACALGENIAIWQSSNGEEVRTLNANCPVTAIAFIDGQTLTSGDASGAIKTWQPFTGDSRLLAQHSAAITSLAISPNGQILATGSEDNAIQLWQLNSGEALRTLSGHSSGICSVAISPDGRSLASGSSDKTIKLWQLDTGEEMLTLQGHLGAVKSVAISPDGETLASGSSDKTIKLWNLATGEEISTIKLHSGDVNSVAFSVSEEGQILVSGSEDKNIQIWRAIA
ncbi:MAG: hypothetical protein F6J93_19495 [Oscillatoria sp. SIO1A7]|nr:hypothetical protein [Oscillatoria sp. SIO1A7]